MVSEVWAELTLNANNVDVVEKLLGSYLGTSTVHFYYL